MTRETFIFAVNKEKLKKAELRDGHYLLRSNLVGEDPAVLWERYVQLTPIKASFRSLKSDLGIRPIHHQLQHRLEAHILVAFLAYRLSTEIVVETFGVPLLKNKDLRTVKTPGCENWARISGANIRRPR